MKFLLIYLSLANLNNADYRLCKIDSTKFYLYNIKSREKTIFKDSTYAYTNQVNNQIGANRKFSKKELIEKFPSKVFFKNCSDSIFIDRDQLYLELLFRNDKKNYELLNLIFQKAGTFEKHINYDKTSITQFANKEYQFSVDELYCEWYVITISKEIADSVLGMDIHCLYGDKKSITLFILKNQIKSVSN